MITVDTLTNPVSARANLPQERIDHHAPRSESSCPFGTGRFSLRHSRHFVPGYHHKIPPGQTVTEGDKNRVNGFGLKNLG
jgi:hypothetical protein